MGLSTDHPLFINISHVSVGILVGDLPSYECSASNVWYCKKSFQLFLNLQGSSNNNEIDHVYLTFLVSIAIFMQTTKGKNEKERLQQQECIQQRLNLQLHDHSLSLVIIRQMP